MGLLGRASETDDQKTEQILNNILIQNETVEGSFILYRDRFIFTNLRLIILNSMGVGKEKSYRSISYDMITSFEIRTHGLANITSSLVIWLIGDTQTGIELKFNNDRGIYKVQQILATHCLLPG